MTDLAFAAVGYASAAATLLAVSPIVARDLGVPAGELRRAIWSALVAFPVLLAALGAIIMLLWEYTP